MNSKIMKELATNPRAQMRFQTTGQVPRLRDPLDTPLRQLLLTMSPRDRIQYRGIRLSPKLGYQNSQQFQNGEQLFRWLGGSDQLLERQTLPSEAWAIRSFQKRLTRADLAEHCAQAPAEPGL